MIVETDQPVPPRGLDVGAVESTTCPISARLAASLHPAEFTMSNDPTVRRLLPQNSQMGTFTFAPPAYQQQPRETQKSAPSTPVSPLVLCPEWDVPDQLLDYVFVDEHNRHKRLKGMQAPRCFAVLRAARALRVYKGGTEKLTLPWFSDESM